jgi:uncharacterized membrane protein
MLAQDLVLLGFVLLVIAVALIVAGSALSTKEARFAVGGFIGPIPFGWASDPRMLWFLIVLLLVLALLFILPGLKQFI